MSKESYIRGFCKAAEAHGVNRQELAKLAYSTPVSEALSSLVPDIAQELIIPRSSVVTNSIGYISGLIADQDNKQKGNWLNFVPGVSGYRKGNRIKTQVLRELEYIKKNKQHQGARPVAHAVAEHLGYLASTIGTAGVGALIGSLLSKRRGIGAIIGAGIGAQASAIANLGAAIAAGVKKRRTKEEQAESDKDSLLWKYLVPGSATYGLFKRIGRSQGERDEDTKNKKEGK